jgi:hypothetical protein
MPASDDELAPDGGRGSGLATAPAITDRGAAGDGATKPGGIAIRAIDAG